MVQDIVSGDGARKEISELENTIMKRDKYISFQDSVILAKDSTILSHQRTETDNSRIADINKRTIETLNSRVKKYKRQRNVFRVITAAAVILLIIK